MRKIIKVTLFTLLTPLVALLLIAGIAQIYVKTQGNFHTVEDAKFYRSAQLDQEQFQHYIRQEHIKSIINLRGAADEPWYKEELAVSSEFNVTHVDFPMTAFKVYDINTTSSLVELYKSLPKPILVHCHGGADRSALASALWRFAMANESVQEAKVAFNHLYGYLPYLMWEKKKNLEISFDEFVKAQR